MSERVNSAPTKQVSAEQQWKVSKKNIIAIIKMDLI